VLWTSAEELLISYNDAPFVSEQYRTALDGVGARAERLAGGDLPPELAAWVDTLGQDNVRSLSVSLLIDLLTIETEPARAEEIAHDMTAPGRRPAAVGRLRGRPGGDPRARRSRRLVQDRPGCLPPGARSPRRVDRHA
jgi:hypothetical protein